MMYLEGRFVFLNDMDVKDPMQFFLVFSPNLLEVFGFTREQLWASDDVGRVIHAANFRKLNPKIDFVYLYCNLAANSIVGNTKAPLLQIINLDGVENDRVLSKSFNRIHYHPIVRNTFQTVEIDLRDDRGRAIPFQHDSRVVAVLHIRRNRYKGLSL